MLQQLEQMAASTEIPNMQQQLQLLLQQFQQVFDSQQARPAADFKPPLHCRIPLVDGATPYRVTSPRPLSPLMLMELRRQLQQLLDAGYIRPSSSEWAAPVVFAAKADGSWRMCCDMRQLNQRSVRTAYPLPLVGEIMEQLKGATCFSTLDLKQGFHQVPMDPVDIPKTAFTTRYGLFEWVVMPFGLSGAPGQFMRYMNSVLQPVLDKCAIVFMDDILVFSASPEQHVRDLEQVFSLLSRAGLSCKASKCKLMQTSVRFLGYVVSGQGVAVDPRKVEAISRWPVPTEQRHVRQFLGMANFYRRFIRKFSMIAKPLNDLLKTGSGGHTAAGSRAAGRAAVDWGPAQQSAFEELKSALTSPPVLATYSPELQCVMTTDASEYGVGGVLEQETPGGRRPVAYASRSLTPAEQNYGATDRENLALVYCLDEWQHMLEGSPHRVLCYTDHQALVDLLTKEKLSRRQARWIMAMAQYDLQVQYIPGQFNIMADALSRKPDLEEEVAPAALGAPEGWQLLQKFGLEQAYADYVAAQLAAQQQLSVHQQQLAAQRQAAPAHQQQSAMQRPEGVAVQQGAQPHIAAVTLTVQPDTGFLEAVKAAYQRDPKTAALIQRLQQGDSMVGSSGQAWALRDGVLWQEQGGQARIYLPADQQLQQQVLQLFHDEPSAAHRGAAKTLARIRQHYTWAGIVAQVRRYVHSCLVCQAVKASNQQPAGLAQPLPIPDRPWQHVSMDFVGPLPVSSGYNLVAVVVDRFSKMAHFMPLTDKASAPDVARAFVSGVYRLHGLPSSIVSDRDKTFVSDFWGSLMSLLGIKACLSTANHPETDGQTERVNRVLKEMLRGYINSRQDNWAALLPQFEFAYNSSVHESTGYAPFQVVNGYVPASVADRMVATGQPVRQQPPGVQGKGPNQAAESLALDLSRVHAEVKANMAKAQLKQVEQSNKGRRAVQFKAGDRVLLSTAFLRDLKAPGARSLHRKYFGPFSIVRMRGPNAAELDLPASWSHIHHVINVKYLRLCIDSDEFGVRVLPPPDPELVDGELEYEVESILDVRTRQYGRGSRKEYLVEWKGYPLWECTWEPASALANAPELIKEFHQLQQHSAALLMLCLGDAC